MKYNNTYVHMDGIKFRSKLESVCYELLKEADLKFEYEPSKWELVPGIEYNTPSWEKIGKTYKKQRVKVSAITYVPDFVGDDWLIECKGFFTPEARIKWKLLKQYLHKNKLSYRLFMPTNKTQLKKTIELIKYGE